MSENNSKAKRDFAININEVHMLGRVAGDPKDRGDKVGVPIVVPAYKSGGGKQWVPYTIDVVGDDKGVVKGAKPGDYVELTARFASRPITDDEGNKKSVLVLQHNPYRPLTVRPGNVGDGYDPLNPPADDVCFTRVTLAGRNFIRSKQMKDGKGDTPVLRGDPGKEYCYITLRYEDPFQPIPDEGYLESLFLDFSVNGEVAKRANQFCRNRAQVVMIGELLSKKEAGFTVRGKTPKEPKISVSPGGFFFNNLDRSGGGARNEPKAAEGYNEDDTGGIDGLDDDLPF